MPSLLSDAKQNRKFYITLLSIGMCTMNQSQITEALKALNIRPDEIADERLAEAFRILLLLIEVLSEENEKLKAEIQRLRDAINLLKGEQAKPDIKPSRKRPNEDIRHLFRGRKKIQKYPKKEEIKSKETKDKNRPCRGV